MSQHLARHLVRRSIKKFPKIRQALITEDKDKKKDLLQDKINFG